MERSERPAKKPSEVSKEALTTVSPISYPLLLSSLPEIKEYTETSRYYFTCCFSLTLKENVI